MIALPMIYYINLNRSLHRKEQMIKQFEKYKIDNYNRIEAIDGASSTVYDKYHSHNNKATKMELATTLSHIKAIKKAYDDNCQYALILEDDIDISILFEFMDLFCKIINNLPTDSDIIQLHMLSFYSEAIPDDIFVKWNICKQMWGAAMYYIKRSGMEKILKLINADNLVDCSKIYPVADYLIYYVNNSYTTTMPFGIPFCKDSTIHPEHVNIYHKSRINSAWKLIENIRKRYNRVYYSVFKNPHSSYEFIVNSKEISNKKNIPGYDIILLILDISIDMFSVEKDVDVYGYDQKFYDNINTFTKDLISLLYNKKYSFVVHKNIIYYKCIENVQKYKKKSSGRYLYYLKHEIIDFIITHKDIINIKINQSSFQTIFNT